MVSSVFTTILKIRMTDLYMLRFYPGFVSLFTEYILHTYLI